jgi:hypothetical protein
VRGIDGGKTLAGKRRTHYLRYGHLLADTVTDLLRRATEMDITMIGLQNAGKTSLLRVLAVSFNSSLFISYLSLV